MLSIAQVIVVVYMNIARFMYYTLRYRVYCYLFIYNSLTVWGKMQKKY